MFGLGGGSKEERFWKWFQKRERQFHAFTSDEVAAREKLFDQLARELSKVHRDLSFEFGPPAERREFVISASGIWAAFPAVTALVTAAPPLARWNVTAFRPRREPMTIQIGEICIAPDDVEFELLDNGKIAGIRLFFPGVVEGDVRFKQIGYLLLDGALGEYDVETKLGLIEILPSTHADVSDRFPLASLPEQFDRLVAQLEGPRRAQ